MKIVAVTACPTGIAHTYMAADALQKSANTLNIKIKIETQGAMGVENMLTAKDIVAADLVLIVSDIDIAQNERFAGCNVLHIPLESVLLDAKTALYKAIRHA
ncbi:PTS fructose transporter subunit IIB [Kosakonia sp. S42]|uniref:PTS fructose transporter subunit IIB n=1 Tax=Kosakonia sp. S42 TaxID=2767458 RepID=UPI00190A94EA|nr:PTS fructose transporter subunit IIB [Kosakonia sp. S42]MBK0019483.1 PTS fructose transporter subunit IIB [Kosakonia sp. S42]